ncbi:hypothetical protein ACH40E_12695 [Streptomyces acidicola]|uniref:hypothetical protein n=1 Tax=Streptomyces acidicola TaxID=2596892 RepID=UPI0037B33F6D
MVFTYLAEELRCGDVAVLGSEEYADWSQQLLAWEAVQEKLADYLVEVPSTGPARPPSTCTSTPCSASRARTSSTGT